MYDLKLHSIRVIILVGHGFSKQTSVQILAPPLLSFVIRGQVSELVLLFYLENAKGNNTKPK